MERKRIENIWELKEMGFYDQIYGKISDEELEHKILESQEFLRKTTIPPNCVGMKFDLTLPIDPQVEYTRKLLKDWQAKEGKEAGMKKTLPRCHKDKWVDYLRILDAYDDGAKPKEIASVIFPNEPNEFPDYRGSDKVKKNRKRAFEMVNGGYRKIVLLEDLGFL